MKKINVNYFQKKKEDGEKIVALTAYDFVIAQFAENAGVELILVGDSLGMSVLGYETTVMVTLDEMLHHCKAVVRGTKNSFVVGDMPFMTYQISDEEAMKNATRFLQEGGVDAIKLEGGKEKAKLISRLTSAGVPVMGHIGLLPQKVMTAGGYKIAGKTEETALSLIQDAVALEQAGVFAIVLEGIPSKVSKKITETVSIPTIGIGAGEACDGQIQVVNDVLGLTTGYLPKHSKQYANLNDTIKNAFENYKNEVKSSDFPTNKESF